MPINFPNSPSPSQLYSYDNKTWEWNGTYWEVYSALTSYVGGTGTTNNIPKWSGVNSLTDSIIYDGGFIGIYTTSQTYQEILSVQGGDGGIVNNSFNFVGHSSNSIAIADANYRTWGSTGGEIAIGPGQPLLNSTGSNNIAIGNLSLAGNTSGIENVAVGKSTLINNQTGQGNVAIGNNVGANVTSGSYNVLIGYEAGSDLTTEDNRLYIANNTYGTLIYGDFHGNRVGINTTNPLATLDVSGSTMTTTISAATYYNLPTDVFVNSGVYANGQILFTNTTGGTFSVTNIPIGGAGGQPYYFNMSASQTPYREFAPSATTAAEQTTAVTISASATTTLENFLTPSGLPGITLIPAGYWTFYLHAARASSITTFDIFCEVYTRTTGGTETLILSTDPAEVTALGTPAMYISDGYYSGSSISSSDRILVKVRATNTGTNSTNITFYTEGTQHYSYGITPFTSGGAVTSVGLSVGTTGTDVNVSNSPITSSGNILLNIPDASATARGLVTTGNQTFAGSKTINGSLTITGTTTSSIISATTYQNLPFSGTVTSVALSAGTSGSDINIVNSAITTSGTITINIPDASITARGVVSTGTQTFKGNKTFDGTIGSLNFSGDKILYSTNTSVIGELSTTTYPSLTELSYVKGATSAIQTQLNNKFNTSGGTITGDLIVTGNTNVSGSTTSTGNVTSLTNLQSLYSVGDEGGEILLSKPQTNTSISGTGVTIDIYQNRLRFFETGGSNRGAYIEITAATASAGSNLLASGGGGVTSLTAGTGLSGNTTTGAVSLQLSAASYSMFANNTAVAGVPSQVTYEETGEADFSATSTITWGTTPSPAGNYRYRWQQIGNMVVFAFEWTSSGIGILPITITLPTDMPAPAIPTGFNAASYVTHRYFCTFNNAQGGGGATTTTGNMVLRRNSGNTGWEFNNPFTNSVRWFNFNGHYFT